MPILIIIILCAWFIFGEPAKNVANWFWDNSPAPWEKVDAFYYPDRDRLGDVVSAYNVGGMEQCRMWVREEAAKRGDPQLERGDYECGVGFLEMFGDLSVYRLTLE